MSILFVKANCTRVERSRIWGWKLILETSYNKIASLDAFIYFVVQHVAYFLSLTAYGPFTRSKRSDSFCNRWTHYVKTKTSHVKKHQLCSFMQKRVDNSLQKKAPENWLLDQKTYKKTMLRNQNNLFLKILPVKR